MLKHLLAEHPLLGCGPITKTGHAFAFRPFVRLRLRFGPNELLLDCLQRPAGYRPRIENRFPVSSPVFQHLLAEHPLLG